MHCILNNTKLKCITITKLLILLILVNNCNIVFLPSNIYSVSYNKLKLFNKFDGLYWDYLFKNNCILIKCCNSY